MTDHDLKLIEGHLNGTLSRDELEALNRLLENDAAARARYLALATLDEGLQDLAAGGAGEEAASRDALPGSLAGSAGEKISVFSRPLAAAAAGLILGVFCTSAIWAASESGRQKILTLFQESFESGADPLPSGAPIEPGSWGGDFAEISGAVPGVVPVDGQRMFRFLRADYEGKENPIGYVGDIYRVIDLRRHTSRFADGDAVVVVETAFASAADGESKQFFANLSLNALDKVPAEAEAWRTLISGARRLDEVSLASARRRHALSPASGNPWQRVSVELRLPRETRFLLIGLHVADRQAARTHGGAPPAVRFSGQFADDVRVFLRPGNDLL